MEETKGSSAWIFFAITFAGTVAAVLHYAEQGTDNLLHRPAKSVVRKSIAPIFNDEMQRRVIKAEMRRPAGTEAVMHPFQIIYVDKAELENPCLTGNCHGEVSPTYRSALDSIIIKEELQ